MNSIMARNNPSFLKNLGEHVGELEIPLVHKITFPEGKIDLIACCETKPNDSPDNYNKGVHFFVDDYRFNALRDDVTRGLRKYYKYAFILTPDFSRYNEMRTWQIINAVGLNRWCGVAWQQLGLRVIPSIGWASPSTYKYCFVGVERNAPVAITTNGNRWNKEQYLHGYDAMLEALSPSHIICYGKPFSEMRGNIIPVNNNYKRKA